MTFDTTLKGQLKAKLQGFLHQPNISLCSALVFVLGIILFLCIFIYPTNKIFVLVMIAILVLAVLAFLGVYLWRTDPTESIQLSPDGTLVIKSPSRQLIPALIGRLVGTTNRPNKLIPRDVDPKEDPSKFQFLTDAQGEEIVKKEAEEAVLNHPIVKSSLPPN